MGRRSREKREKRLATQVFDPTARLDQALDTWETSYRVEALLYRFRSRTNSTWERFIVGPIKYWQDFRRHLLHVNQESYDAGKFEISEKLRAQDLKSVPVGLVSFPEALSCWSRCSRRVYRISEDLQLLLQNTSIGNLTWREVPWPFDSFVLIPAVPLRDNCGKNYDCILVSRVRHPLFLTPCLMVKMFSTEFGDHLPSREQFRRGLQRMEFVLDQIDSADSQKNARILVEEARQLEGLKEDFSMKYAGYYISDDIQGRKVADVEFGNMFRNPDEAEEDTDSQNQHPEMLISARLIVGLSLYLTTLPSGSTRKSDWKKRQGPATPDLSAITSEAEVCFVKSTNILTPEEKNILGGEHGGQTGTEACAHFRTGHWRREPGRGHDPFAKKTVHVRPTIVRKDRLLPGTIPKGLLAVTK